MSTQNLDTSSNLLKRDHLVSIIKTPISTNLIFGLIGLITAVYFLVAEGLIIGLIIQALITLYLSISNAYVYYEVEKKIFLNRKKLRNLSDTSSLLTSSFVIIYYLFFGIYEIIYELSWVNVLSIILGLFISIMIYKNALHINVLLLKMEQLVEEDLEKYQN